MLSFRRFVYFSSAILFAVVPAFAHIAPCPSGTMASVLGTSCSVGSMIFTFQSTFNANLGVFDQNNVILSRAISPAEIGFVPIQTTDHAGFQLQTNFNDGPGSDSTFSSGHIVQFSYSIQAASGAVIRAQGLSMDAAAHGDPLSTAFIQVLDFQQYPNAGFLATETGIRNDQNITVFDQHSDNVLLEVPGLLSTESSISTSTTQIFSFSTALASTALNSVTFLYTTGPFAPSPSLGAFTYVNIDLPGADTTSASGITNSGRVIGSYRDNAGKIHAYVMEPQGTFANIDVPEARSTFGQGLNDRGDVVGAYTDLAGKTHGFVLSHGDLKVFDVPQAISTGPLAINDRGQIVGVYQSADLRLHGFLLDDGVFTTIDHGPSNGFSATEANAINNAGRVAGAVFLPNTFRAFSQANDFVELFDVPGQGDSIINGINDQNDAVGSYRDLNLVQHGFVLYRDTFRTVDFPDSTRSLAVGINASGAIIGRYSGADRRFHSFLALPAKDDGQNRRPMTTTTPQLLERADCGDQKLQHERLLLREPTECLLQH